MKLRSWIIEHFFLRIGDILNASDFVRQLKVHRSYNNLTAKQLEQLQTDKLVTMLKHATNNTEFYKTYKKEESDTQVWLGKFPVINKRTTIDFTDQLLASGFERSKLIKYESSGSSGLRSTVYLDKKEQSIIRAILIILWEWNGYYFGKPLFQTGMSPQRSILKKLKDTLLSTYYFNAFNLNESHVVTALNEKKSKNNMHLMGYASSLYEIARIAKKNSIQIKFDKAMSWGDKLFQHYKTEIESAFNCQIVEGYGLNEGFMIGQQKDLPYYYQYSPNVYLEILNDEGDAVPHGEMGRIIATKLDGFAMPLIRYDTGDLGIMLPKENYPKQMDLNFPLIQKVIGRNTDIIKTSEGNTLIVHTFTGIFEFYEEISQFQIVQNKLEAIQVKYVPSSKFEPSVLERIEKDFFQKTSSKIIFEWLCVDKIEPSKSGKPQLIINNLITESLANTQ